MAFRVNPIFVPKSYSDWAVWFSRQSAITRNKASKKLGRNDEVFNFGSEFVFEFYGHRIARYVPEHTRLYTCGYSESPSTVSRLNDLTRARIYQLGSRDPRHTKFRVNGLPFFEGIRILPDGSVHPEDVRPDVVTKKRPEVVQAYTRLFRQIKSSLRTRWEIGEFEGIAHYMRPDYRTLCQVIALFAEGKTFIPHAWVPVLLPIRSGYSFDETVNYTRELLRRDYLRNNNGFYDEEIQNAAQ